VGPGFIIQTHTEPVLLKYGKLVTKYPWIYGYFLQCRVLLKHSALRCDTEVSTLLRQQIVREVLAFADQFAMYMGLLLH